MTYETDYTGTARVTEPGGEHPEDRPAPSRLAADITPTRLRADAAALRAEAEDHAEAGAYHWARECRVNAARLEATADKMEGR